MENCGWCKNGLIDNFGLHSKPHCAEWIEYNRQPAGYLISTAATGLTQSTTKIDQGELYPCHWCGAMVVVRGQLRIHPLPVCVQWDNASRIDTQKTQSTKSAKTTGRYVTIGQEIGELVEKKQQAYGDSFGKSGAVLRILYPNG